MAIRGILFDKDGTIIDYCRTWLPLNRRAALHAAGGDQAMAAELLRLAGHDPETDRVAPGAPLAAGDFNDIARAFAAHPRLQAGPHLAAEIERVFCEGSAEQSALLDGARATLVELRQRGLRLGLATNDSAAGVEASLASHDILHLFHFTAGCDSGHGAKPEPGMALAFCRATGLSPSEIAMVGDAVHDLAMGRAASAGLCIGVLSGTSGRQDLEHYADLILDSINELPALPQLANS